MGEGKAVMEPGERRTVTARADRLLVVGDRLGIAAPFGEEDPPVQPRFLQAGFELEGPGVVAISVGGLAEGPAGQGPGCNSMSRISAPAAMQVWKADAASLNLRSRNAQRPR